MVAELAKHRFAPRLIALPHLLVESIRGTADNNKTDSGSSIQTLSATNTEQSAEQAPERPSRSRFSQRSAEKDNIFRVIRGEGPLQETLACFQMLALQLNLLSQ